MADRRDGFALFEAALHELHRMLVGAQMVGPDGAARDHDRVVVGTRSVSEGVLYLELAGRLVVALLGLDRAGLHAQQNPLPASFSHGPQRLGQFEVVGSFVCDEERYSLACQVLCHASRVKAWIVRTVTAATGS